MNYTDQFGIRNWSAFAIIRETMEAIGSPRGQFVAAVTGARIGMAATDDSGLIIIAASGSQIIHANSKLSSKPTAY